MDHDELRVPLPPAADAAEKELRCDGVAFSILGILRIIGIDNRQERKRRGYEWEKEKRGGATMMLRVEARGWYVLWIRADV